MQIYNRVDIIYKYTTFSNHLLISLLFISHLLSHCIYPSPCFFITYITTKPPIHIYRRSTLHFQSPTETPYFNLHCRSYKERPDCLFIPYCYHDWSPIVVAAPSRTTYHSKCYSSDLKHASVLNCRRSLRLDERIFLTDCKVVLVNWLTMR